MKAKKGRYRLSPNEEAQLLKEETEKRRKLRLLQVREQAKQNASKIRNDVRQERQRQITKLAVELQDQLEKEKDEKVRQLETQYENCLRSIGHGHKDAGEQVDQDEERELLQAEYNRKAESRGRAAVDKLRSDRIIQEYDDNKRIIFRNAALEVERNRAADIAALPPPPPDPLQHIDQSQKKIIKTTNADAFSSTYFHMSQDYAVDKVAAENQEDAKIAAEEEEERMRLEQLGLQRLYNDRMARARVRHQHALKKEMLKHDYDKMLMDLSDLQRSDRDRRQKVVANIPKQVFEPPYKRLEDKEDNQKFMEEAFEDMYMAETNYTGDISLALDPHPPPESSSVGESLSESGLTDATPIPEPSLPRVPPVLRDMTNVSKQETEKFQQKKPEKVLRKLMDKIKSQREWHSKSVNGFPEQELSEQPEKDEHIPTLSEYTISEKGSPREAQQRHKYSPPEKQARVQKDVLDIPTGAPSAVQPGAPIHTTKDTLLHPMETAAQIRQAMKLQEMEDSGEEVYPGQSQTKKTVDTIMEQQRQIEKQRKELEDKLKKLEEQQRSLSGSLTMTTGTLVTTVPSTGSFAAKTIPDTRTTGFHPSKSASITSNGYPPSSASVQMSSAGLMAHMNGTSHPQTLPSQFTSGTFQPFSDTNKGYSVPLSIAPNFTKSYEPGIVDYLSPAARDRESPEYFTSSLPTKSTWGGVPGVGSVDLSKVREYQNNLLTKHEHSKNILAQTRAEIERRRQELLKRFPQLDLKPLGTAQVSASVPTSSSLHTSFQEPDAGLKPDHSIRSRSPGRSSVSNLLSNLASDPYYASRLTEPTDKKQDKNDIVNQTRPSVIPVTEEQKKAGTKFEGIRKSLPFDFDESLQESPFQVKTGILGKNTIRSDSELTTESDMSALKEDMDESAMSSSTDRGSPALPGRRSAPTSESDSSLLSAAKDREEYFEKRQADLRRQLQEIQKQKDQIIHRQKVGQQKLQAQQDMLRDKIIYSQTIHAADSSPTSAEESRDDDFADYERKQEPSTRTSIPLYRPTQYMAEHKPHELSIIQEVDTPRSNRKSLESGRPSLSSTSSSVSRRSLDFNQPSTTIPEEKEYIITPTDRRIIGDPGYEAAKIEDIISKAREFDPSMMDKFKRQTNDIFTNLDEDSLREDSFPRKSGASGSFVSLSTGPLTPESMSTGPVDDSSVSAVSTSMPDSFAFKYVNQSGSGRDDSARRDNTVSGSFKSSWASELSSYNGKSQARKPDMSGRTSYDSKQEGSFKYLKPSSEKSFDSEMGTSAQDSTKDSSGKFSNLEFNRGSGTDQSQNIDRLQVDRSYDVLHMRDSDVTEYHSLPSGLYSRKDSLDRKTLTDVSDRPSSEDMSQYSLPDNYKSAEKLSEMSQYSFSDKGESGLSNLDQSPTDLRSSEISHSKLPSGKDYVDVYSTTDVSEKPSSVDNLSRTSESVDELAQNGRSENYPDLSQYPLSEKSDLLVENFDQVERSPSDLRAAEMSQFTMISPDSSPQDLPVRRSPIGDLDESSSSGVKGDNLPYTESTTSWSEDVTTPSSSHYDFKGNKSEESASEIERKIESRDIYSKFSPVKTSQTDNSEMPTFGRKLDFTSTPFITGNVPAIGRLSELSQYTISPESESSAPSESRSLPFQSFTPNIEGSSGQNFPGSQSLSQYSLKTDTPGITLIGRDMSHGQSDLRTDTSEKDPSLSQYTMALETPQYSSIGQDSAAAPGSLSQYTLNTSGFITKTPLSQYTIPENGSYGNEELPLSQQTYQDNGVPSLTQYTFHTPEADPSLSQYSIKSDTDKHTDGLSLTQYSLDRTENNVNHDATANMSDNKGMASLSQYSITTEEDDSFVQKKFANLDQLILESRNLIEKHKQLVSRNKDLDEKEIAPTSLPDKGLQFMGIQNGDFGTETSQETSLPPTFTSDSYSAFGAGFQSSAGISNFPTESRFAGGFVFSDDKGQPSNVTGYGDDRVERSKITGYTDDRVERSEIIGFTEDGGERSNITEYSVGDEQKEHETGISEEPDLTLVTLSSEVSMVEDPSQVSSAASESVLSFEKHEQSLADSESPRDSDLDARDRLNLQEAFMIHRQNFMDAAKDIKTRSQDRSPQRDAGESDVFRAVPVMVSPSISLSMEFNSSQEFKFTKPPVTWTKEDDEAPQGKSESKEQPSEKPKKVPPPVPQKPKKPIPAARPTGGLNTGGLNRALQPRKSETKKHAVVSPEKPGAISLGDLISSTKDLGPHQLKKTEVRKPQLSPRSFQPSSAKSAKTSHDSSGPSKKPVAGALSKTLSSWKKSRAVKPTGAAALPQKPADLPSSGVKVQPPDMSSEEYESNMRLNRSLEETDVKTKKSTDDKQKQAAANREKVKEFQKRLQENVKKKQQQRKEKK